MTVITMLLYTEGKAGGNTKTHQNINMVASECLKRILIFLLFTVLWNIPNIPHDRGGGRESAIHLFFLSS